MSWLAALSRHSVWRAKVCVSLEMPLSCNLGSFSGQGTVLAHLTSVALRAPGASSPVANCRSPSMQMAVWTLITLALHLQVAMRFNDDVAQVRIGFVVPLQLQRLVEKADVWPPPF